MGRLFAVLTAIAALLVLAAGIASHWLSAMDAQKAKSDAAASVSAGLAANLSQQLDTLQKAVDGLAQTPDVVDAFNSGDPNTLQAAAAKLQTTIPYLQSLHLLPAAIGEIGQPQTYPLSFGDMEMARATLTGTVTPVIQGDAENRHLAISSASRDGQKVVGVVLASLKPDLPRQLLAKTPFTLGRIELKQDQLTLASLGEALDTTPTPLKTDIGQSRWQLHTWLQPETSWSDTGLLTAAIGLPALLAVLTFFLGYRKLAAALAEDQSCILAAAKDMMQGRHAGNYPMRVHELQPIIAAMAQFKRVISQGESQAIKEENQDYAFFEESSDNVFLQDIMPGLASTPIKVTEMPAANRQPAKFGEQADSSFEITELSSGEDLFARLSADNTSLSAADFGSQETSVPVSLPQAIPFIGQDICGLVGQKITPQLIGQIGRAFASEAQQRQVKTVIVARDCRQSSPVLAQALIEGIVSAGCDVLDLGIVPAPVLYFVAQHSEGHCGAMVTGGQQSADYNGLKMLLAGDLLQAQTVAPLQTRIDNGDYRQGQTGKVEQNTLFATEYIGVVAEDLHLVRPMTLVVDCVNGATARLAPMLFKTMGCNVIELNCDIDSPVPFASAPVNLAALQQTVRQHQADAGIAFDGDGECLALVDSDGRIVAADRLLMLLAREVLAAKRGANIVYGGSSANGVTAFVKQYGGGLIQAGSGAAALQTKLKENGAVLAGDAEGRFLFQDRWFGFGDALYAAARTVQNLSADTRPSALLFDDLTQG